MHVWAQGMRELKLTGYLQQNLRHTVGQFLVETLGVDWRVGEDQRKYMTKNGSEWKK